ncbi:MAG: hypothetical protein EOO41_03730, partial [Methanobacteriota archaeon]
MNRTQYRNTWEIAARAAFEADAVPDVADVCARFAADAEVFKTSISCLVSMSSVPRCVASIMASPTVTSQIIQAVGTNFASIDFTTPSLVEGLQTLQPALGLLLSMARQDPVAFDRAGGIKQLLEMAGTDARPKQSGVAAAKQLDAFSQFIAAVTNILDRASRSKAGLEALMLRPNAELMIKIASINLMAATTRTNLGALLVRDKRRSFTDPALLLAAALGSKVDTVNAHLEPAYRTLERIARTDAGRDMLLSASATYKLAHIMPTVLRMPAVAPLAMRLLARLLGSNAVALVDRIAGIARPGEAAPELLERVMCARLLAYLMRDREYSRALAENDGALARRVLEQVESEPLRSSEGAPSLVSALMHMAQANTNNIVVLEEMGAIKKVME